jgi:hypothetical protein
MQIKEKVKCRAVDRHFDNHKSGLGVIPFYGIHNIIHHHRAVNNYLNKKVNRPLPMDNGLL